LGTQDGWTSPDCYGDTSCASDEKNALISPLAAYNFVQGAIVGACGSRNG